MRCSSNKKPVFSVILPTFNRAYCLEKAIQSVLKQSFEKWELLIVDDGSTDQTFSLVKSIQKKDPRILYCYQTNQGPAYARKLGLKHSKGDYIAFLDSDDIFKPNHLETRFQMIQTQPQTEFLYGGAEIIGNPYVPDKYNSTKSLHLEKDHLPIGGTFIIKKESLVKMGGFPLASYSEDSALFERAKRRGLLMKEVFKKTYVYNRMSLDSICSRMVLDI